MAQKAQKSLAVANAKRLNQTLFTTLAVHAIYILLRLLFRSFTRRSLTLYLLLSLPQLLIYASQEATSRPKHTADGSIRTAGSDLDAPGLTEYMWDVTYWTWGCVVLAGVLGDKGWWAWAVIPAYSVYAAWTTYQGMRGGFTDAAGVPQPGGPAMSKRQAKMEKRGGQKVAYR